MIRALALCSLLAAGQATAEGWQTSTPESARKAADTFAGRLAVVAKDALETAYADGPLGEGPGGTHDKDPLIDLSKVDCVTFVEEAIALAGAPGYGRAFGLLQQIRYNKGEIGFESRNHFFVSDWLRHNAWCRDAVTEVMPNAPTLTRTISRREFFQKVNAPEFGQATADESITIHYIPGARAKEATPRLPSPAVITFIGKIDWLFALHCGLYIREGDASGKLYHASSKAGKVVATDLAGYLEENEGRYVGFLVHEITPPPEK